MDLKLRLGQELSQEIRQTTRISQEAKLELKQLLLLRLELHSPAPIEAVKGLEGIGAAHALLQKKKLRGILIGSLAVELWNTTNTESLARHKDVDVVVLPPDQGKVSIAKFEAGVDWWLPQHERLEIKESGTSQVGEVRWWENGNGVVVGAGLKLDSRTIPQLPVGISVPTPAWLLKMQVAEVLARVDERLVATSDEALEALERSLEKKTNPKKRSLDGVVPLSTFAAYAFKFGLDKLPQDKTLALELDGLDLPTLVAINSSKKK